MASKKRGLARLDDLTEIARANGWHTGRERMVGVDLPDGTEDAEGWIAERTLDDGRKAYWMVVYGKPVGRGWQVLRLEGRWAATARIEEPTVPEYMGVDVERYFENINQLEYWLAHFGELLNLWREEDTLLPRKTMTERVRDATQGTT